MTTRTEGGPGEPPARVLHQPQRHQRKRPASDSTGDQLKPVFGPCPAPPCDLRKSRVVISTFRSLPVDQPAGLNRKPTAARPTAVTRGGAAGPGRGTRPPSWSGPTAEASEFRRPPTSSWIVTSDRSLDPPSRLGLVRSLSMACKFGQMGGSSSSFGHERKVLVQGGEQTHFQLGQFRGAT